MGTRSAVLAALAALLSGDGAGNVLLDQSPPQFDNSLKLATTAAMVRQGLQASGIFSFNVNTSLTAAHMGGVAYSYGASALAFNLPPAGSSAFPLGSKISVLNAGAQSLTVTPVGSDKINIGGLTPANVIVQPQDTVDFTWNGGSWFVTGGSAMLANSGLFAASLGTTGYQKLPGGLIIQWGTSTVASTGTAVTFPIAFTNATLNAGITLFGSTSATVAYASLSSISSKTGMTLYCNTASQSALWFAIGY